VNGASFSGCSPAGSGGVSMPYEEKNSDEVFACFSAFEFSTLGLSRRGGAME
jgi:hypothetical protein